LMQFGEGAKLEAAVRKAKQRLAKAEAAIDETKQAQVAAKATLDQKESVFEEAKSAFQRASEERSSAQNVMNDATRAGAEAKTELEEATEALKDARDAEFAWLEENPLEAAGKAGGKVGEAVGMGLLTAVFGESKSAKAAREQEEREREAEELKQRRQRSEEEKAERAKLAEKWKGQREILAEARKIERQLAADRKRVQQERKKTSSPGVESREETQTKADVEPETVPASNASSVEVPPAEKVAPATPAPAPAASFPVGVAWINLTASEREAALAAGVRRSAEFRKRRNEAKEVARTMRPRTLTDTIATGAVEGFLDVFSASDSPIGTLAAKQKEELRSKIEEEEKRKMFELFASDWELFNYTVDEAMHTDFAEVRLRWLQMLRWSEELPMRWEKDPDRPADIPDLYEIQEAKAVCFKLLAGRNPGARPEIKQPSPDDSRIPR